jgi:hypothetical protein
MCVGVCVRLLFAYWRSAAAEHKDFTVDFAHPIDNKLAIFLQSPASVESLVLGGLLQVSHRPPSLPWVVRASCQVCPCLTRPAHVMLVTRACL